MDSTWGPMKRTFLRAIYQNTPPCSRHFPSQIQLLSLLLILTECILIISPASHANRDSSGICCNQIGHQNISFLSPAPSFALTAPHDFLTSYSGKTLLSSSLMLCSSVGLRLWEILSITNEYLILDQNLSLVQPPALLISLFPWDAQEWDVMTRPWITCTDLRASWA